MLNFLQEEWQLLNNVEYEEGRLKKITDLKFMEIAIIVDQIIGLNFSLKMGHLIFFQIQINI